MIDGYIKWYRKAETNPALKCEKFDELHAWLWLVERANYKRTTIRFNGGYKTLQRGQLWTSIRELADTWSWGVHKVMRFLELLEKNEMIRRVSNVDGTLLTIEKYSDYQDSGNTYDNTTNTNSNTNSNADGTPLDVENYSVSRSCGNTNSNTNSNVNSTQKNENKGGHGQHRSDDRASVPNNDPRYMEIAMGEPDEFIYRGD